MLKMLSASQLPQVEQEPPPQPAQPPPLPAPLTTRPSLTAANTDIVRDV
jgi:hypothetical protein